MRPHASFEKISFVELSGKKRIDAICGALFDRWSIFVPVRRGQRKNFAKSAIFQIYKPISQNHQVWRQIGFTSVFFV